MTDTSPTSSEKSSSLSDFLEHPPLVVALEVDLPSHPGLDVSPAVQAAYFFLRAQHTADKRDSFPLKDILQEVDLPASCHFLLVKISLFNGVKVACAFNLSMSYAHELFPCESVQKLLQPSTSTPVENIYLVTKSSAGVQRVPITNTLLPFSHNFFAPGGTFKPHVWGWLEHYHPEDIVFFTRGLGTTKQYGYFFIQARADAAPPEWQSVQ